MKKIGDYIGFFLFTAFSWLPFCLLYLLSDLLFVFVFHLVKYRKKIVLDNLRHSFPDKDQQEISTITYKFYRHFCDMLVESIKLKTISAKELKKRMQVVNPELPNDYFDAGKSVLVLTMHYNNWEWQTILPHYLKHRCLLVYNPARNLRWDAFINHMRERFGGELVSTKKILKTVLNNEQSQSLTFTWLCADQRPKKNTSFWTKFLNRDAGFFPGPEALARRTNQVVLYQRIEKIKRGYYQTSFEVLTEDPSVLKQDEILNLYVRKIENQIIACPEFYLWSHKRWKHKPPESGKNKQL